MVSDGAGRRDDDTVLLAPEVLAHLEKQLPAVAELGLEAVTSEVPEYTGTFHGEMAANVSAAIAFALGVFLRLLEQGTDGDGVDTPLATARQGAYDLGRGEAKAGRTVDALLAAYRIGARVSWRSMSATAVEEGVDADAISRFAELVFAFIDELSAASVAGHADQLARSGRVREERRTRLATALLTGAPPARLTELAEAADWTPPATLTAVVLPSSRARQPLGLLGADTLQVPADAVGITSAEPEVVLLVADAVATRAHLLGVLEGHAAAVGPARPWDRAQESVALAVRARALLGTAGGGVLDTAEHLVELVVGADLGALDDLRTEVLAPLGDLPPATAARLGETLRAWLTHLGRRGDVAAALHVHPQTVRYRMNQLREAYGDRLDDPKVVERLVVALSLHARDSPTKHP
jgi:hypothetical protein